jgi:hypothetical protein
MLKLSTYSVILDKDKKIHAVKSMETQLLPCFHSVLNIKLLYSPLKVVPININYRGKRNKLY